MEYACDNLLGVVILPYQEGNEGPVYFLPLCKCIAPSGDSPEFSHTSMKLPLVCETTLRDRWEAFGQILNSSTEKVMFNSQLCFLPIFSSLQLIDSNMSPLDFCVNIFDPKVASYLCDGEDASESHLEFAYLLDRYNLITRAQSSSNNSSVGSIARVVMQTRSELIALLKLKDLLQVKLNDSSTMKLFAEIEMPLVSMLTFMELLGVAVDTNRLDVLKVSIESTLNSLVTEVVNMLDGYTFNLASPEQVSVVLYEKLKLPPPIDSKASKNGSKVGRHPSTSEEDLSRIKHLHPIVEMVLNHRSLNKLMTTYVMNYNDIFFIIFFFRSGQWI